MITVIAQNVTGRTRGYNNMVSNSNAFPVNAWEDVIMDGCLDAPDNILTGCARFHLKYAGGSIVFADTALREGL